VGQRARLGAAILNAQPPLHSCARPQDQARARGTRRRRDAPQSCTRRSAATTRRDAAMWEFLERSESPLLDEAGTVTWTAGFHSRPHAVRLPVSAVACSRRLAGGLTGVQDRRAVPSSVRASVRGVMIVVMCRADVVHREPSGGVLGAFAMSSPVRSSLLRSVQSAQDGLSWTRLDISGCLVMKGSGVRVPPSACGFGSAPSFAAH
jgi:hypothetical protein